MSAGNLYRTFPSKEAIVEGLCELDQAELARAFAELMAHNRQIMQAVCCGMRRHVLAKSPEKARLLVEIWAEAGRNPRVAAMTRAIDAEVLARLETLPRRGQGQRRGLVSARFPFRRPVLLSPLSPASSSELRSNPISTLKPRRRWRSVCSRLCSMGRCAPTRLRRAWRHSACDGS